jgi:hypothetical protein
LPLFLSASRDRYKFIAIGPEIRLKGYLRAFMPVEFGHQAKREKRGIAEGRFWSGKGTGRRSGRMAEI